MADIIVGISDLKVTTSSEDILVTYALGSCVGISVYDPVLKIGGLLHYMLPDSSLDPAKAAEVPAMFADTGIPLLFKSCYRLGAEKKRLIVKVAGGASILDDTNYFRIGQKNLTAMRRLFWKNNVMITAEDTGLTYNRTMRFFMDTGKLVLKISNGTMKEI